MVNVSDPIKISFKGNDLAVIGTVPEILLSRFPNKKFKNYTAFFPRDYFPILKELNKNFIEYLTSISFDFDFHSSITPTYKLYDFQQEAIESWIKHKKQGTIILPTGSGKTIVALEAIVKCKMKSLIVVPTLALVDQWVSRLSSLLSIPREAIGEFGGGKHDIKEITIITYDSAYLYTKRLRLQFGLMILDEAHHLVGSNYQLIADGYLAPFRLGLTATLDPEENSHEILMTKGFGPIVYQKSPDEIQQAESGVLVDYRIVTITVQIDELEEYKRLIGILQNYIKKLPRSKKLSVFQQIIFRVNRDEKAQQALQAYREARKISFSAKQKIVELEKLLKQYTDEKMIIFSDYVHFCEEVARKFFLPCITHRTSTEERRYILNYFQRCSNAKLIASKILDEGIDIPDAKIGVILISSSSKRQFVQRLGRILRSHSSKNEAILYEIVSEDTLEEGLARKRKQL